MRNPRAALVLRQVELLWSTGTAAGLTDEQLLDRFLARPGVAGEAAFAALVDRHGPMVLNVCRGLLRDPSDADDAFQATFLTLAQRARSIGRPELLGPWLHGVARRKASKLRQQIHRRRGHEARRAEQGGEPSSYATPTEPELREQAELLHEEIGRLPGKYRMPIVLCYLEGLTHDEAAHQLGWPVGTVRGRLARARTQLGARLTRRGLAVSGAALVALNRPTMTLAAVPPGLARATTRAALRLAAGREAVAVASAAVAALVERGPRAWTLLGLKAPAALVLAFGIAAAGGAALLGRSEKGTPALTLDRPFEPSAQREDSPGPTLRRTFRVTRRLYRRGNQQEGGALAGRTDRLSESVRSDRTPSGDEGPAGRPAGPTFRAARTVYQVRSLDGGRSFTQRFAGRIGDGRVPPGAVEQPLP